MDFYLIVVVGSYTKILRKGTFGLTFVFKLGLMLKEERRMGVSEDRVLGPRRK